MTKKADVITFGCRLNIYESQVIKEIVEKENIENVAIFNTCAVTKEAERQARQAIRKYKREHPEATIIVTGCAAQINPDRYKALPEVDHVLGNIEKLDPANYKLTKPKEGRRSAQGPEISESQIASTSKSRLAFQQALSSGKTVLVQDIMVVRELIAHTVSSFEGKVRAFIQIQNGCNHRCTFCTIPYGRGNSRSLPWEQIKTQIEQLMRKGYKEFVLTGVDITDYGQDLPGTPTLGQTIKRLLECLPSLDRLRLSSLDPSEIDADLWDLIETEPRLLPHFHLSIQAGDDLILKRMKRRHLRHHIVDFLKRVRAARPDVVIGADIIAGFPTETESMLENTRDLVRQLDLLHIFPFSPHDRVPASKMPQVPKSVIKERATALRQDAEHCLKLALERFVGKEEKMLIEEIKNKIAFGKTDHYLPGQLPVGEGLSEGDIVSVTVVGVENNFLKLTKY